MNNHYNNTNINMEPIHNTTTNGKEEVPMNPYINMNPINNINAPPTTSSSHSATNGKGKVPSTSNIDIFPDPNFLLEHLKEVLLLYHEKCLENKDNDKKQ